MNDDDETTLVDEAKIARPGLEVTIRIARETSASDVADAIRDAFRGIGYTDETVSDYMGRGI